MAPRDMTTFSACSGACQQGRLLCPHPEACEVPQDDDDDGPPMDRTGVFLLVLAILLSWVLVLGLIHVGRMVYAMATGV